MLIAITIENGQTFEISDRDPYVPEFQKSELAIAADAMIVLCLRDQENLSYSFEYDGETVTYDGKRLNYKLMLEHYAG